MKRAQLWILKLGSSFCRCLHNNSTWITSIYLDSVAEQAGMGLTWAGTPMTGFHMTTLRWFCFCLFGLSLYVPVNNFSVIAGLNKSWVEPVLSNEDERLAQGHNTAPLVRFEPATLRSRVRHCTLRW